MKRLVLGVLAILLILSFSGCSDGESPVKVSAKYYVTDGYGAGTQKIPIVEIIANVDSIVIKNVIANNGNCRMTALRQKEFPQTLKFGQKATAGYLAGCNMLKAKVITNQGDWEFTFDNIPEQYVQ